MPIGSFPYMMSQQILVGIIILSRLGVVQVAWAGNSDMISRDRVSRCGADRNGGNRNCTPFGGEV